MRKRRSLELKPIGIIHSPYRDRNDAPHQGYRSEKISRIEVFKELEEGLQDIEEFSHIIVIYWFHKSKGYHLLARTPWDDIPHGLFSTRSPRRPCPLGLAVVQLIARERNILKVKGLDAINGTPLLDIKPYIPGVDQRPAAKAGWLKGELVRGIC